MTLAPDSKQTVTFYVDDNSKRFNEPIKVTYLKFRLRLGVFFILFELQVRDFNPKHYPNLNALLDTLTPKAQRLSYGARVVTTAGGKTRISKIDEIAPNNTLELEYIYRFFYFKLFI